MAEELLVDTSEDYRAFIFALHPEHGMLLLKSREKHKKGSYWEVPGGHLDDADYETAVENGASHEAHQLLMAAKIGASRELYEESGIDIRNKLSRLQAAVLKGNGKTSGALARLRNLYKGRLFYFLQLHDSDFLTDGGVGPSEPEGLSLRIKLSHEHLIWEFITDAETAVDLLATYSGGKVSEALQLCLEASVPGNSTQALLKSDFQGGSSASDKDQQNDGGSSASTTQQENCAAVSTCQADACSEPMVDACALTGYVETVVCSSTPDDASSSAKTTYRSCSLPDSVTSDLARKNLSILPFVFFLILCLAAVGLIWKRRSDRTKWLQRKSRFFDDDAFVVNGGDLELVEEPHPMDLPPVD